MKHAVKFSFYLLDRSKSLESKEEIKLKQYLQFIIGILSLHFGSEFIFAVQLSNSNANEEEKTKIF